MTSNLPTLPTGWELHDFKSLCNIFDDGDWIESKDQSENGVRLIQTGNIGIGYFKDRGEKARYISIETFSRLNCTEIFEGDCLVSRLPDPIGRACILPNVGERMITAVDCTIVRFKNKIIPEYFNYYAQSSLYLSTVDKLSTGATRKRISKKNLSEIKIPLPPLNEQKRLVSLLDTLFAKIDRSIELLDENIAAADALLPSALNTVFGEMENKPKQCLKDITSKIGSGATPSGGEKAYKQSGISLIRSMNVHDDGFRDKNLAFIDDMQAQRLNNVIVQENDVLLNITGASVARCCIVDSQYLPARVNQHVAIIRLNEEILPQYVHYYLISPNTKNDLLFNAGGGATREAITKKMIEEFEIPLPPLDIQTQSVEYLDSIRAKVETLKHVQNNKIANLKALKASILDRAFKGEL